MKNYISLIMLMSIGILLTQWIELEAKNKKESYKKNITQSLPMGPYSRSCDNCKITNDAKIQCSCNDGQGSKNFTKLPYKQCTSTINNCNGILNCGECYPGEGLDKLSMKLKNIVSAIEQLSIMKVSMMNQGKPTDMKMPNCMCSRKSFRKKTTMNEEKP